MSDCRHLPLSHPQMVICFHLCLLNDDELDIKKALRNGGGVDEVAEILLRAVGLKPTGHRLDEGVSPQGRSMFQIGG